MRLKPEEIAQITEHLISVLRRKRFSVKTDRNGTISYAEKFGIRCTPAILNSIEDGRHGYAYINLVTSPYSSMDLGSYYRPRTNKSTHRTFDRNDAVDRYAGDDVHIDTHNYKRVIEDFANRLNKDYVRIVRKSESVNESKVTINGTGTIFDGMSADVESEDADSVTVWLELNGHRIRNRFGKDNVSRAGEVTEDANLRPTDDDFDLIDFVDDYARALTEYLSEQDIPCQIEKSYPDDNYGYNGHLYKNIEDDSEYLVCTGDEAEEFVKESLMDAVRDSGPIGVFGIERVMEYLDEDYFDDMLREDAEYRVYDLSDDEMVDELESYGLIGEKDMIKDPDWEPDPDNPDEEPDMIYPEGIADGRKEDLIEAMINSYSSGIDWYLEVYGKSGLEEMLSDSNNDDCIDLDKMINDFAGYCDFGEELASYDGSEIAINYEDRSGRTKRVYAYRVE